MAQNTDFEVTVDPSEIGSLDAQPEASDGLKYCPDCGRAVKYTAKGKPYAHKCEPPEEVKVDVDLDSSAPEEGVTIWIDEVEGLANYETVGVNGKGYQIKRGEPVTVPEAVVEALRNSIATRTIQTRNPVTGVMDYEYRNYSSIPWRKV